MLGRPVPTRYMEGAPEVQVCKLTKFLEAQDGNVSA